MMAPTLSACAGAGAAADGSLVAERNASLASCLVRSTNAICCDASTGTLRTRTPPRCTARHRSGGTPTPIGAATVRERLPASPPLPNGRGSAWSGTRHHHLDPPALHGHAHLVGRPASRLRRRAGVRHRHPDRQLVAGCYSTGCMADHLSLWWLAAIPGIAVVLGLQFMLHGIRVEREMKRCRYGKALKMLDGPLSWPSASLSRSLRADIQIGR